MTILEPGQKYKAPDCPDCGSRNTFTQGTIQMAPMTLHKCKCRNCGANWKDISKRVSTSVD